MRHFGSAQPSSAHSSAAVWQSASWQRSVSQAAVSSPHPAHCGSVQPVAHRALRDRRPRTHFRQLGFLHLPSAQPSAHSLPQASAHSLSQAATHFPSQPSPHSLPQPAAQSGSQFLSAQPSSRQPAALHFVSHSFAASAHSPHDGSVHSASAQPAGSVALTRLVGHSGLLQFGSPHPALKDAHPAMATRSRAQVHPKSSVLLRLFIPSSTAQTAPRPKSRILRL